MLKITWSWGFDPTNLASGSTSAVVNSEIAGDHQVVVRAELLMQIGLVEVGDGVADDRNRVTLVRVATGDQTRFHQYDCRTPPKSAWSPHIGHSKPASGRLWERSTPPGVR